MPVNHLATDYEVCLGKLREPTVWLRYTKTKTSLPGKNIGQESPLLLFIAKLDQRRKTNRVPATKSPDNTKIPTACQLIDYDEIVEAVPLLGRNVPWQPLTL